MVKHILLAVAAGEAGFILVNYIQQKKIDKLKDTLLSISNEKIDCIKRLITMGNETFTSVEEWKDLSSAILDVLNS